jgi:hypothetical protein
MLVAAILAAGHTALMWGLPEYAFSGEGVPIPPFMIWMLVDCPLSFLAIALGGEKIHFLICGGIQWGIWGYLIGRIMRKVSSH